MKTNQLRYFLIWGMLLISYLGFIPALKALEAPGGCSVTINGATWNDPDPLHHNPITMVKIPKCGADAVAGAFVNKCLNGNDDGIKCGTVNVSCGGSITVKEIASDCFHTTYKIEVTNPKQPGWVVISASAADQGYVGVHTCGSRSFAVAGGGYYDPNGNAPCTTACVAPSPPAASSQVDVDSLEFRLNLGSASTIESAGYFWLYADLPSTNLSKPSALQIPHIGLNVEVISNMDGSIAQVKTPQVLVNVRTQNDYKYQLEFFYATNVTAMSGGRYGTNASAFDTWILENPDTNSSVNRFWITEQPLNGTTRQFKYTYISTNLEWDLLQPDGQTVVSTWKVPNVSDATITNYFRQESHGGNVARLSSKTYQSVTATGERLLLKEVDGLGAAAQTNTFSYYTTGGGSNQLRRADYATGNWTYRTYDGYGRVLKEYSPYNNSAPPSSGEPDPAVNPCKVRAYTYDVAIIDTNTTKNPFESRIELVSLPVPSGVAWDSRAVASKHSVVYSGIDGKKVTFLYDNPADTNASMETVVTNAYQQWFAIGKPGLITNSDGTITAFEYLDEFTTVTTDFDGSRTTNVVDELGNPLYNTKIDINTGVILARKIYIYTNSTGAYYDQLRRSHDETDLAGRTTQYRYGDCCGSYTVTDPDGNVTQYTDDLLKRQVASTTFFGAAYGITKTNILDGVGRILVSQRIGTNGTVITQQQFLYDSLGNVIRQTNALGGVTTITNVVIDYQLHVTNTYPDGGTRVEIYYRDGRLQSVTGTAVHPMEYIYGSEQTEAGIWREYTQEIKLTLTGGTNEWTKTYVDGMGHNYKTVYSSASAPYPASQNYYNDFGQLWKQVDPDGVTTMYTYYPQTSFDLNAGQTKYTINALSDAALGLTNYDSLVGAMSSLFSNGIDRIQKISRSVVPASGKPDLIKIDNYVWTNNETDENGTLISSRQTATTTLTNWNIAYADVNTAVTNVFITALGTSRAQIAIAPDKSYSLTSYSYGRLISINRYDSTGNPLGANIYRYDAQGRPNSMTDARNGTTTMVFNNADLVTTNASPNPGGESPEITAVIYDKMLRSTNVIQPDGASVSSIYLFTGELGLQFGSRTYPVGYGYDYAGRMKTMTNWSSFSTLGGARVTTWNYDDFRGWLTNKGYADGKGPFYTYTSAGRLAARVWVRGVTASYAYDGTGSLTNIVYSDLTPGVTNIYDRLGRLSSVSWANVTDTMTHNLANQLLTESFSGGVLNGFSITNGYDALLRRTNLSVLASGVLSRTAYGYDNASRLATVDDGNNDTATYSYVANSPLVNQITFQQSGTMRMTTTKSYDYLNRLKHISSAPSGSGTVPVTFNYTYNSANQRTKNVLENGSYWIYQYDNLGQVTNGVKYFADGTLIPGQTFGYQFDDIGNRKQTIAGGDGNVGSGLRLAVYTNNTLNQITSRDYPGTNDVIGTALATNAVTVNGQTTWRKGEYFWATVKSNNNTAAQWEGIKVVSGGNTNNGNLYVPKTPEQFSYDADGNLTNDGHWAYAWDAENRLILMTNNTNVGPQYQLTFAYDAKGRRIQKMVATNGVALSTNKFLYDSWNLIAETRPNNSLIRSYVWGTDLSGTSQGASGVGGLLEISYYGASTTNCFPAFDGNGNIMALVNAADGTLAANYDYSAFGEPIRITGVMAGNNPFRFSTKYVDNESDLLYYGYRYYKPSTGTWLSRDPISEMGGKNLYAFVANRPINAFDAFGLYKDPDLENMGEEFGKGDKRGFWMGISFLLDPGSAMLSKISLTGSSTPCCGGTTKTISKPALYQFTTADSTFEFGGYNGEGAWSHEQNRSMLHLSKGDLATEGYEGSITITLEYQIRASTPVPPGFVNSDPDHGPSSTTQPQDWNPNKKNSITCKWDCKKQGVRCEQDPENGIAESGPQRKGRDGTPRN